MSLHPALKKAQDLGATFASLRHEVGRSVGLTADEQRAYVDVLANGGGYMLTALINGNFVYKFTHHEPRAFDIESIPSISVRPGDDTMPTMPALRGRDVQALAPNMGKTPEDKMTDIKELRDMVLKSIPSVRSVSASYTDVVVDKEYFDTNGREVTQRVTNSGIAVDVTAGTPNGSATAIETAGTTLGYVFDFAKPEILVDNVTRKIDAQLRGSPVKEGEYQVVLGPDAVGTFSHESVGHLAEVDYTGAKDPLYVRRGSRIASPAVSIVDAPSIPSPLAGCRMRYDDEGTESVPVRIIDKGVISGFMTDLFQSSKLKLPPTGNSRAQDVMSAPMIRMRNTYMEAGDMTAEELISGVKHGYLILSTTVGQTSASDGTFTFAVGEGYKIERGHIVASLRSGVGISGFTFETLGNIEAVGKDVEFYSAFCGKGSDEDHRQNVPISHGGPHIRLSKLKVG